mmetsp:Transcript_11341/g.14937  ORF Transcript_11341/g.14937 Transcript_11341/m.14937 type:complete len:521 (-) Transcript_11341:121-1683(-)|eukprot:CAMPEP_0198155076 /NCGR_PEP_ID=MMETSP1443-20131203/68946_1 /TAXON_ID=186043 /ORGANISM="Entomoneis sp., Strain CCMP2396" /LENGTH=520 /DNA_ID=CAMNT_0043821813 /DNA_START=66 /DNA_END=1628 /DNA_ORIENTATION=-
MSSRSKAEAEWEKFERVYELLGTVNEYMAIYSRLKASGGLIIIGSKVVEGNEEDGGICHSIPKGCDRSEWNALNPEAQYQSMVKQAEETMTEMNELEIPIQKKFTVEIHKGPLKGEERVKQKRDLDYNGNVRRVVDFVRCSLIIVLESLHQIKKIVGSFSSGGDLANEWALVRIKDGFEKPENFIVGGYRDIKLNVRCLRTGHIIEIQLHLREFLDLKEREGHAHYEFARNLKVDGVTKATQLVQGDHEELQEICDVGEEQLEKCKDPMEKVKILRRLGDLYSAMWLHGKFAVLRYDKALQILEEQPLDNEADRSTHILLCEVLADLSYCVSEIQRHCAERSNMRTDDPNWMEVDTLPWIDRAIDIAMKYLEPRHPLTMRCKRIKADNLDGRNENAKAEALYELVLRDQKEVLGKDHPETIETMNNFGDFLTERYEDKDRKNYVKGICLYMDGLEGALKRLGPDHVTTKMLAETIKGELEDNSDLLDENPQLKERGQEIVENYEDYADLFEEEKSGFCCC